MRISRMSPLAVVLLLAAPSLLCTTGSGMKIGFVNYDEAISLENKAKRFIEDLKKRQATVAAWRQEAQTKIETKVKEYQEKMDKLSKEKRLTEEKALNEEISKIRREDEAKNQELAAMEDKGFKELKEENSALINAIAEKGKYDLVINAGALVWASPKVLKDNDLTKQLADEYNKKNPVKASTAPSAPATTKPQATAPTAPNVIHKPAGESSPEPKKSDVKK